MTTEMINQTEVNFHSHSGDSVSQGLPAQMKRVMHLLRKMKHGALCVTFPDGKTVAFGDGTRPMTLTMHTWGVAAAVLKSGDIGCAESYISGDWHTDDLPGLIAFFIRNRSDVESMIYGSWWGRLAYRVRHLFNRNTKSGSRKNIHAHYDIGNDFYQLWLDPSMTYSSALYRGEQTQSLEQAQAAKYRRVADELQLAAGMHVLEVGCGWGGFAEFSASEAEVQVMGLTLSTEQLHFSNQRIARAGIAHRVEFRLQDYRDVHGCFDAIASIEMFEAVGEAYWPSYFECIARNLKQGGRACIQTIVIADHMFERYRRSTDFIQQYIFPGGMLPSPQKFRELASLHGLSIVNELAFGQDYARTTAEWREAFHRAMPQVRALDFDERFIRTWDFYLAYCEAGFRAGSIDVMQFTLLKP